jgi:tripartite-type tricarboxylate transporter receptor subunit TctC
MKSTFAAMLALSLVSLSLQAADFPIKDKPVTLVVPFAAGGPTDRVARDLAEAMRKTLGNSVVVENATFGIHAISTRNPS